MDWTQFNWVDWAFCAALLYGAALGAVRGLSHELATLVGMLLWAPLHFVLDGLRLRRRG